MQLFVTTHDQSRFLTKAAFSLSGGMLHISVTGTSDLHTMYTLSPWACSPQVVGIYMRQITYSNVSIISYICFKAFKRQLDVAQK